MGPGRKTACHCETVTPHIREASSSPARSPPSTPRPSAGATLAGISSDTSSSGTPAGSLPIPAGPIEQLIKDIYEVPEGLEDKYREVADGLHESFKPIDRPRRMQKEEDDEQMNTNYKME